MARSPTQPCMACSDVNGIQSHSVLSTSEASPLVRPTRRLALLFLAGVCGGGPVNASFRLHPIVKVVAFFAFLHHVAAFALVAALTAEFVLL